jgi:very-short-patch-repair endonuclease
MSALRESASVLTGPPGTGKSEVIASVLLNQLLRGRPTLFASKNHQALAAVVPRLNTGFDGGGELIVQASSRDPAQRRTYLASLQTLLARPPRADTAGGEALVAHLKQLFTRQRAALLALDELERLRERYESAEARVAQLRLAHGVHPGWDEAIAAWPRDISHEQVDAWHRELHDLVAPPTGWLVKLSRALRRRRIRARLDALRSALQRLPSVPGGESLPDATAAADAWRPLFASWRAAAEGAQLADTVREAEHRLIDLDGGERHTCELAEAQRGIESATRQWAVWASAGLPNPLTPQEREDLANLRAGVQIWGPDRCRRELRKSFRVVLRAFPLWSVSNLSARSALPLVPALFELAVIDEASQCDIASVVPLLARSRRAVIAGDPMQLQHVSTLDVVAEQALLQQHQLTDSSLQRFTYRVNSAFDLVSASAALPDRARVRLDLHFRSHEAIADYCNDAFYGKTLHVVTATERLTLPRHRRPGIHWTHVSGRVEAGPTGAWSAEEIQAVRHELLSLAEEEYGGTIGVVTPFRHQMIRLKDALEADNALPRAFLERTHFAAATAHGFQGDERDLILFSLCAGPDMPNGATVFLRENPNLFNVAVSRARAVLHVVGNREWASQCGISFVEKLAQRVASSSRCPSSAEAEPYQSPWERVLAQALRDAGIEVLPQYAIAGRFLDLAILSPRKVDVEVDGESVHRTARGGRRDDDHWRDLQLQSLGWRVRRFWVYELREDLASCVRRVHQALKER